MFLKIIFITDLVLVTLCLGCSTQAFSNCSERGLLYHCGAWASHCSGFSCRAQDLGAQALVVPTRQLSSYGMQALGPAGFSSGP